MKTKKAQKRTTKTQLLPESFRPLLWWLDWSALDVNKDGEDIIVSTINEGSVDQWGWVRKMYGDRKIKSTISRRLESELHPESLNLARVIFDIKHVRHARRSTHAGST